jgi:hypothetical protein
MNEHRIINGTDPSLADCKPMPMARIPEKFKHVTLVGTSQNHAETLRTQTRRRLDAPRVGIASAMPQDHLNVGCCPGEFRGTPNKAT